MDKYAETKAIISAMADVKMKMNSHKGNIEDLSFTKLLDGFRAEENEMIKAVSEDTLMHVIEELADCQNFLIAIGHKVITQYRNRKNEQTS